MTHEKMPLCRFEALLKQRADSAELTRARLNGALDRFERNELTILPPGSKLTLRNLALEAAVSKDTPLSRYRADHSNAGSYRFPDIAARFRQLKAHGTVNPSTCDSRKPKIQQLRVTIAALEEKIVLLARVNNQLDAEAGDLKQRCRELTAENARLRQQAIKAIAFGD